MATTEREALIAALPRALMDAARRDTLNDADRVAIGQAIVVVQDAQRAALAAPPVEQQAAPVISVEDSLRTRLSWEQDRVQALEDEARDLRSKLPGATERDAAFMGLMTAQAAQPAAQAETDHDALRCAVGNCTFNGEVPRHAPNCPNSSPEAPQAGAATYTAADVSDAHAKGYKLGLAQLDRPTEQPSQDAERLDFLDAFLRQSGGGVSLSGAGPVRQIIDAARSAQAQAQGEKGKA